MFWTMGILRIKKTDGETEEPLEGVEFTLYEKESEEAVATLVTDKDGNAESIQLPIGIYGDGVLKEITTYVLKAMRNRKKSGRLFLSIRMIRHQSLR